MKPAATVAVILLTVVAIGHALRVVFQVQVTAGDVVVPMWVSVLAALVAASLAMWLRREQRD